MQTRLSRRLFDMPLFNALRTVIIMETTVVCPGLAMIGKKKSVIIMRLWMTFMVIITDSLGLQYGQISELLEKMRMG